MAGRFENGVSHYSMYECSSEFTLRSPIKSFCTRVRDGEYPSLRHPGQTNSDTQYFGNIATGARYIGGIKQHFAKHS